MPITGHTSGTFIGRQLYLKHFLVVILFSASLAGCGADIDGTYENAEMSVEFKSGKAYLTTTGGTVEVDYSVDGDNVILHNQAGRLVLTRISEESLEGPLGTLKKKGA